MSGDPSRTIEKESPQKGITIKGFNNSRSSVDSVGVNDDGKLEYYVSSMPSDLTLLSAHDYVKDGAAKVYYCQWMLMTVPNSWII